MHHLFLHSPATLTLRTLETRHNVCTVTFAFTRERNTAVLPEQRMLETRSLTHTPFSFLIACSAASVSPFAQSTCSL